MADEDNVEQVVDESTTQAAQPQAGKHNSGTADLEKVTDFTEEKEISGNLDNAINVIASKRKKEAEQKAELEKRLASVKLKKEDVDLVVAEFEVSKSKAERVLKENDGDLERALFALVHA
jgi:NACalpha-BTF3-like transcription factor